VRSRDSLPDAREQRVVGRAVVEVLQGVRRNKRFRGTSADAITKDGSGGVGDDNRQSVGGNGRSRTE